jgi:hypothetical protein
MRLILSCTGVLVVGVTSAARERGRERERVRSCGEVSELASVASLLLCLPLLVSFSLRVFVRVSVPLLPRVGRPWTSPFIDTRRWPSCTMGYSYVLTWLAEERLEPCTCANVAVGEVP